MAEVCATCDGKGGEFDEFCGRGKPYWRECLMCGGFGLRNLEWERSGGIDHILISGNRSGWSATACGLVGPAGAQHREPRRKCRQCREVIKAVRPWRRGEHRPVSTSEVPCDQAGFVHPSRLSLAPMKG